MVACCSGIYFFLLRYYFYNKYNIHAKRAVLNSLNIYNQEFELLSIDFETKELKTGHSKYVHLWTFVLQDSQGRQFYAYEYGYGLIEKGDGDFVATDYYYYTDDTYGQLCIEERLDDKYDLSQYRQEKGSRLDSPYWDDYIFVCTKENADEIAELLTEIYFKETEFSNGGCLRCSVNNEQGETLFSYHWWNITRELQEQNIKITEQTVYAYILQELKIGLGGKFDTYLRTYGLIEKEDRGYPTADSDNVFHSFTDGNPIS